MIGRTTGDAGRRRAVVEVRQDVLARLAALHAGGTRQALQLAGLVHAVLGTRVCARGSGAHQNLTDFMCAGSSRSANQLYSLQRAQP